MRQGHRHTPSGMRARSVLVDCSFVPVAAWPRDLVDPVATLLADALVRDIRAYPIGELPTSDLPS